MEAHPGAMEFTLESCEAHLEAMDMFIETFCIIQ
jgi:hypothetical protein